MTLLTRKLDQSVVLDDIKITVLEIKRGYLQIGIEVTDDVRMHREVIYKKITTESKRKGLNFSNIN